MEKGFTRMPVKRKQRKRTTIDNTSRITTRMLRLTHTLKPHSYRYADVASEKLRMQICSINGE